MDDKILLVDDDVNILSGYKRQLYKKYQVETAESGKEGLNLIKGKGPFSVVVSDYMMPEMNGVDFLEEVRKISPDTVRIMLTGQADIQATIDVINKGNIFRFLTKPCPPELFQKNLEAGIEQYRLINSEKELLGKTLIGSIKMATELLALAKPLAFNRSLRIRKLVKQLVVEMDLDNAWSIEIAAMLSQIGCLTIPDRILERIYSNLTMSEYELTMFKKHPKIAGDMIEGIPRLKPVAEIIAYQEKNYDGSGFPKDFIKGDEIPLGARILKVALDFDKQIISRKDPESSVNELRKKAQFYDSKVLDILIKLVKKEEKTRKKYSVKYVGIQELNEEMLLADNLVSNSGVILGNARQKISNSMMVTLANYQENNEIREPIKVMVTV